MEACNLKITLQFEQSILVRHREVKLSDIADICCSKKALLKSLKELHVYTLREDEKKHVLSAIDIVELLSNHYPEADVDIYGEDSFIVCFFPDKKKSKALEYLKTALVCLIMFFGAAFSVATFNNDVDVNLLFNQLLGSLGEKPQEMVLLQVSYSAGIPLGMLIFYNHLSKKSMYNDPTPLEVEMRLYEQEADKAAILNESRKSEHDNS